MDSFYSLSGGKLDSGFVKTYISVKEPRSKTTKTWKSEHPYSKEALEKAIKFEDGLTKKKGKKSKTKKPTQSNTLDSYLKGGYVQGDTNEVKRNLEKYGDRTIIAMKVIRTPLASALNRLLNWVTLGKMKRLKNKHGYNDFFHLALELNLGGGRKIYLEKNERVNLSPRFQMNKKTQTMEVNINGKPQKTVRELYETTKKAIGDYNFYQYRAFSLNCQKFIQDILRVNGFLTPPINQFIMQDVESIAKSLSGTTKKVANFLTDAAGKFSKWFGRGKTKRQKNIKAFAEKLARADELMSLGSKPESIYKGLPKKLRDRVRSMVSKDDPRLQHIHYDYGNQNFYLKPELRKKVQKEVERFFEPTDGNVDHVLQQILSDQSVNH